MLLGRAVPLKHSTSVPFSEGVAVPLSLDEKKVASITPNPVPVVAVKPHVDTPAVVCTRTHELLPPTLHLVSPLLFPVTLHLKVKVSSGQVGGGAVSCPVTSPGEKNTLTHYKLHVAFFKSSCICHIHTL